MQQSRILVDDATECASFFALKAWAVSRSAVWFRRQYADIACTIGLYFLRSKQKISVCRLWMHIRSLWMAIRRLCTAIRSLQTEISVLLYEDFQPFPCIFPDGCKKAGRALRLCAEFFVYLRKD